MKKLILFFLIPLSALPAMQKTVLSYFGRTSYNFRTDATIGNLVIQGLFGIEMEF